MLCVHRALFATVVVNSQKSNTLGVNDQAARCVVNGCAKCRPVEPLLSSTASASGRAELNSSACRGLSKSYAK